MENRTYYKAINWNAIEDVIDKSTWEKLTEQFWLDTRIPLSNDLDDWRKLPQKERDLVAKVFGGLTLLDTLQSEVGVDKLKEYAVTPHEEAVYNNISMMESVHAKSYSSIFSTLNTKSEIEEIFHWVETNEFLQRKAQLVKDIYLGDDKHKKQIASVFLESFLFYSGFFAPLWYLGNNKLPNVAEIIKLIIRDECLTADHELLTPKGWKSIKDITISDKVLQYNADGTTNFVNPKRVSSHYEKEIHEYANYQGHISLSCSPKHRVITRSIETGLLSEVESIDYAKGNKEWIHTGFYDSNGRENLSTIERFMIALHTDGSYSREVNKQGEFKRSGEITGTVPVRFTFSKQRKIDRLLYLANKLQYKSTVEKTKIGKTLIIVYVDKDVIPSDRVKRLPFPNLTTVSGEWCKQYVDELAFWDGHSVKENPNRITWGTVKEEAADIAQTIATLAGYKTHKKVIVDDRSPTCSDYHRIQINTGDDATNSQCIEKTVRDGEMVYGVEVESTYLVTRRNNAVQVTGNSVHGTYIGYKFQVGFNELSEEEQNSLREWMYDFLYQLYENEVEYTKYLYDEVGWTEEVTTFLEYNANKALMNLGQDPLFPTTADDVNPIVMNGISTGTSNHDFFSQVGNGYLLGTVEAMQDDDYSIGLM